MKICYIVTRFSGGVKKYVEDLSSDNNVTVVCGKESDFKTLKKIKIIKNSFLKHYNPIMLSFALFSLYFFFRRNKFDAVHTNSTEAGVVGRMSAKLAGQKVVHTNHAVPFENRFSFGLLVLAEWLASFFSDAIIDVSPRIKKLFEDKNIGVGKHIIIPLGIRIKKAKIAALPVPKRNFKVVCVTRLVKKKGLEKLIEIAKEILKSHKNFSFIIVGDGPLRQELEKLSEGKVIFLGYRTDVPGILKACDLFVLLSEREGTPYVIYEAMAAGLPVISTKIGGIPDQVKAGFLSNPEVNILKLYKNKNLKKKLSEVASKNVPDVKEMVKKTNEVYKRLKQREN